MDALIRQGKVLYWGTSEWSAAQIREAHKIARAHHLHAPTMEQPQYNLLHRERVELEYAPLYAELGLGTTIWSPLASGLLTGKYNDGVPERGAAGRRRATAGCRRGVLGDAGGAPASSARARFTALAAELGVAPAPLAIAWCLRNPHVSTVILGASRTDAAAAEPGGAGAGRALRRSDWQRVEAATA